MARAPKDPVPDLPVLTEQPVDENELPVLTEAPELEGTEHTALEHEDNLPVLTEVPENDADLPVLTEQAEQDTATPVPADMPTEEAPVAEAPHAVAKPPELQTATREGGGTEPATAREAPAARPEAAAKAAQPGGNTKKKPASPDEKPNAGVKAQTVQLTDEQLRKIAAYVAPEVEKLIRKKVSTTLDALWPKIWAEAEAEIPEMIRHLIIDLAKHTRK